MAHAKFEIYKDKGEKYRWRLVAPNGQETASSGQHFASHHAPPKASRSTRPQRTSSTWRSSLPVGSAGH